MSILAKCIWSSISFTPSFHTSLSPLWPKSPTEMTMFPSSVRRFCGALLWCGYVRVTAERNAAFRERFAHFCFCWDKFLIFVLLISGH